MKRPSIPIIVAKSEGGVDQEISLTRVPCVGEYIILNFSRYQIVKVVHYADHVLDVVARITVERE